MYTYVYVWYHTQVYVHGVVEKKLFENCIMRVVRFADDGFYPFVTSSSPRPFFVIHKLGSGICWMEASLWRVIDHPSPLDTHALW